MKDVPGVCDRCNQRFPLKDLKYERRQGKRTWKVCSFCYEYENPQERDVNKLRRIVDKQQVYDPRPDNSTLASRRLWSWDPIGHPTTGAMDLHPGRVRVKIGEV